MKKLVSALALAAALWAAPQASAALTGADVLAPLMQTLALPLDNPSPQTALANAARLGIYADSDSWVDGALTNGLALNLAFRCLGFDVELDVADLLLENRQRFSQTKQESVLLLASTVKPAAPKELVENPDALLTEGGLAALVQWVDQAKKGILWDQKVKTPEGTLWLHRQGVGRPPRSWRISLAQYDTLESARKALAAKKNLPFKPEIFQLEEYYHLSSPLMTNAAEAKKIAAKIDGSIVIEGDSVPSEALFFVGWSPAQSAPGWIASARQFDRKSMVLSRYWGHTNATVGINGGYFGGGAPIGTLFMEGLPQYLPYQGRTMVGWNDQKTYFGPADFRIRIQDQGQTVAVARSINAPPPPGEMAIYVPPLGAQPADNGMGSAAVYQSSEGPRWWAVRSDGPAVPAPGDASFAFDWADESAEGIQWGLQGGPLLLKDGALQTRNEGVAQGVTNRRHPRTLVGTKEGRQWWIVVDGRNSWHSQGMTLKEAAEWGRRAGFTDLLNLDGGGSSEFLYKGKVINNPSDGRERALPYAVLFGGRLQTGGAPLSDPIEALLKGYN